MTFGEKLYRLRKERGMSQEALAQELGVSRQAISRWELEEVAPDTGNVLAASRLFGVSPTICSGTSVNRRRIPRRYAGRSGACRSGRRRWERESCAGCSG